ncbi:MAG: ComF family protein [Bernardetiaceae bacterium]|jgi:ComF family protein|nr:ComF family protein [Bernardetiaceae bacterium]
MPSPLPLLSDLVRLLFPEQCAGCGLALLAGETPLCTACRADLPRTGYHLQADNLLAQQFWGRLPLAHTFAYLHFTRRGLAQRLVHALKYRGQQTVGVLLGQLYGAELAEAGLATAFDVVLPVPLHASKHKARGFNQSDCFAEGLAQGLALPWHAHGLARVRATATQTRKTRAERLDNVEAIFTVAQPNLVTDRRVLLVDDVITTGATTEACGQALLAAGCASLSIAALAVRNN